jgi:hypothetical protein
MKRESEHEVAYYCRKQGYDIDTVMTQSKSGQGMRCMCLVSSHFEKCRRALTG